MELVLRHFSESNHAHNDLRTSPLLLYNTQLGEVPHQLKIHIQTGRLVAMEMQLPAILAKSSQAVGNPNYF